MRKTFPFTPPAAVDHWSSASIMPPPPPPPPPPPNLRCEDLIGRLYLAAGEVINDTIAQLELLHNDPFLPTSPGLDGDSDVDSDISDPCGPQRLAIIEHLKTFINTAADLEQQITNTRYLNHPPPMPAHLKGSLDQLWWYKDNREDDFRRYVRVKSATFDRLVELLSPSPEFHNNSNVPQIDVRIQLAIVLNRVGHYGNAASVAHLADWAGVGEGTVINCTRRVLLAVLDLHDIAFAKPSQDMIDKSKAFAQAVCNAWAGGYMSADGSTLSLFTKPGYYGESYFDKSSAYSMNVQVSFNSTFKLPAC